MHRNRRVASGFVCLLKAIFLFTGGSISFVDLFIRLYVATQKWHLACSLLFMLVKITDLVFIFK